MENTQGKQNFGCCDIRGEEELRDCPWDDQIKQKGKNGKSGNKSGKNKAFGQVS